MDIGIELASAAQKPLLRDLLSQYLAEFERYGGSAPDYPYFDAYWQETESRWPYLIRRDSECIGLAFVNTWSPSGQGTDFSIAEFYIVPDARRHGAGRAAATAVLRAHPGLWELSVMALNTPAQAFWPRAIDAAGGGALERVKSDSETIYRFRIG
ncbi:putative acetyltransferase [Rhizobium petrolearium]|uniref:GNAT family N-acetyltransferase n=1 Tax=Neorhizobium petrolearium TaxID=515361 RepID=UPI001AE33344|nr:GNAT family N-acetyltransferase [Neorhizobium petrolearium]MBP1843506.1 putative acetyltransferase [Neorhizobium petrolearium]